MDLVQYEQIGQTLYGDFAGIVRTVIEQAIAAADLPRPQSIQFRAKSVVSLRTKLEAQGLLGSDSIEKQIKDLAGVRLIFYTNTDVDRFISSGLIQQGFDVDWNEGRIHYPISENAERRYQGIHYTVYLSADRIALPEYVRFKGLRCEIQIQTVLNHAWAETEHDILYKRPKAKGFGAKAFQSIEKRMARLMDEYLLPAGYELQKVQHDFERLMQGKALFDRGTLEVLAQCKDNNERHDVLCSIGEYVLPNYDDVCGIYDDLSRALVEATRSARSCAQKPIESLFGAVPGKTAKDIANQVLEIFDDLRYVDVERTFRSLATLYLDDDSWQVRKEILQVVEHLTQYDLNVWGHVGPYVQYELTEIVAGLTHEQRQALRAVVLKVWRAALRPDIRGTTQSAMDRFTISTGSLPAGDALEAIRGRAITGLLEFWDRSSTVAEQREVFSVLMESTQMPMHGNYSNELRAMILKDTKRVVGAMASRLPGKPYDFLEHVEHQLFFHYHHAKYIAENVRDEFACRNIASTLMTSLLAFRDQLNADEKYVRYKMLVGFETVLPQHWEDWEFDIKGAHDLRNQQVVEYVNEISAATEGDWFELTVRCAATESNDLATFLVFRVFLTELAKTKPATALRFLEKENPHLANFLVPVLKVLSESNLKDEYRALIHSAISQAKHLGAIAQHFQIIGTANAMEGRDLRPKGLKF